MRSGLLTALVLLSLLNEGSAQSYDCDAGLANSRMGWSDLKKDYCCKEHQKGCDEAAQPAPTAPKPWPFSNPEVHRHNNTHMVPPWWVVAGIKPAGATVDYGPYTAAGFSPAQQHQFGVNVTGHIKNFQRFRIATKALQPCIDPKEKQFGLDQKAMMHLLGTVLEDAWEEVTAEDPALKEWTRLRSSCQQQCMTIVLSWSLRTLWSTGELLSRGGGASFSSALADAVRACYPGFRALRADEVAQKVGKIVARGLEKQLPIAAARADFSPDRRLSFNQNPSCLQQSSLDAEDRERFVLQLEVSVEKAVKTAEMRSWSTMEQAARPCQQTCRRAVMKQAAEMLWDAGLLARGNADMLVMTSVEGALAACLTQLPSESAEALAGEALLHMRPEPETSGRLLLSGEAMKMPARDAAGDTGLEGLRLGDLPLGSLSLVGIALLALVPLAHALLKRLRKADLEYEASMFSTASRLLSSLRATVAVWLSMVIVGRDVSCLQSAACACLLAARGGRFWPSQARHSKRDAYMCPLRLSTDDWSGY